MPSDNPSNHRTRFKATKNLSATPVSVKLPRHIDAIVRTIPNRSQWLTDAIVDKLKKEGLIDMPNLEFTAVYSRHGKKDSENFETLSDASAYLENGSDEGWIYAIGIFNSKSKLYWLPDSAMYEEINSKALLEFAATKFEQHDLEYAGSCEN